ncbi:hypothetical protein Tco_0816955 [Tanacetum coccineum]
MEQMTSICDVVGQIMQKKEEERRIAEDQAAKDRYWKIPICYDDDEDYTIINQTKVIKSSVEKLVRSKNDSERISEQLMTILPTVRISIMSTHLSRRAVAKMALRGGGDWVVHKLED